MAVEGEWAWPNCIGCRKRIEKRRPRDFRYGMDVCCAHCMNMIGFSDHHHIAWQVRRAEWRLKDFQKQESHDQHIPEREWQELAKMYALAWARLREYFVMPEFPAGLELFLIEIHNVR